MANSFNHSNVFAETWGGGAFKNRTWHMLGTVQVGSGRPCTLEEKGREAVTDAIY